MTTKWIAPLAIVVCLALPSTAAAQTSLDLSDLEPFVAHLRTLVETADRDGFLALLTTDVDPEAAREFASRRFLAGIDRAAVVPRFLMPSPDDGLTHALTVEIFTETGNRARLETWVLELTAASVSRAIADPTLAASGAVPWEIARYESLGGVGTLHHLQLNRDRQFDASDLVISGEDMTVLMSRGTAFVAEIDSGITGLALLGDGVMTFGPALEAERRQVEIFSGQETLSEEFTHAFIRLHPHALAARVSQMTEEEIVDAGDLAEAQRLFEDLAPLSNTVDMAELSDRTWWLNPAVSQFQADVVTRRRGILTFIESEGQHENIVLYQRSPEFTIVSLYPSARHRAESGTYFDLQDTTAFDVLDYDILASFDPAGVQQESLRARAQLEGCWIDGTTRLALRVANRGMTTFSLQLDDALHVSSVRSQELGPLSFFRLTGRSTVVIQLPSSLPVDTEFSVTVTYAGLLRAQEPDENWMARTRDVFRVEQPMFGIGERRYIYSGAVAWYPQAPTHDFATATMALTVPPEYGVIASGDAEAGNPPLSPRPDESELNTFRFTALQPARYLSAVVSSFWHHETAVDEVLVGPLDEGPPIKSGVVYDRVEVSVETNPRSSDLLAEHYEVTNDILSFYASLIGDVPYPAFTLALTDSYLPGGHSPAYFSILNQPLPLTAGQMWSWGSDPVAFEGVDDFFVAHEIAHQWWGQAVGWKNYHEQWLSEALAQYFAALFIQETRGEEEFRDVLSQMRDWSMRYTDRGPVYLGYRLGLIEGETRVYRALVYNKGAMVLHMLRRLIGDETFFRGLRRYYGEMRFRNAGTDDLIRAFEAESSRSLENFFRQWIHEAALPETSFSYRTETRRSGGERDADIVLRFEQTDQVFEMPVTVTLRYRSGDEETVVVPIAEQVTEVRLPLGGELAGVDVNSDDAMLGDIRR